MAAAVAQTPEQLAKAEQRYALVLLLSVLAALFSSGIYAPFHLDDYTLFSEPAVLSPSGWWQLWRPLQTRPLTYFTFWLNYQLGGQNPVGYHALNIALHLLATGILYKVLCRLIDTRAAFIAAAVFGLHPIQTEPVMYIFERAIILATIFCLLALNSWIDQHYMTAAMWFALALLSKEECAAFPLFLLFIRRAILPAIGMVFLSLAAGLRVIFAIKLLHVSGAGAAAGISPFDYLATQGTVILRYFRLFVLPYGFTFDPDIPVMQGWRAWLPWVFIVAVAVLLCVFYRHGKWFAAGLVLLAPSSTVFPVQDLAADRRFYLPMIAFAALIGLLLKDTRARKVLIPGALVLILLAFGRVQVWRSEQKLCAEAVERSPHKLRPRVLLARSLPPEAAIDVLTNAETIAPNNADVVVEKGLRLLELDLPEPALSEFDRASVIAPGDPKSLNDRGVALAKLGRSGEANQSFIAALKLDPCLSAARKNLAAAGIVYNVPCRGSF